MIKLQSLFLGILLGAIVSEIYSYFQRYYHQKKQEKIYKNLATSSYEGGEMWQMIKELFCRHRWFYKQNALVEYRKGNRETIRTRVSLYGKCSKCGKEIVNL